MFSTFCLFSFKYINFPTISYVVSGTKPEICISPDVLYVLRKYSFPSLYISKVGASTIFPVGSVIVSTLLAVYTSAVKSSTVTSGFIYPLVYSSSFSSVSTICSSVSVDSCSLAIFSFIISVLTSSFSVGMFFACNIFNFIKKSSYV